MKKKYYLIIVLIAPFFIYSQNLIDENNLKQGQWTLLHDETSVECNLVDNVIVGAIKYFKNGKLVLESKMALNNEYHWKLFKNDTIIEGFGRNNEDNLFRLYKLNGENVDKSVSLEISKIDQIFPSFYGGEKALVSYISNSISFKNISKVKLNVKFTIDQNGKAVDINITNTTNVSFNDDIIKIISEMPNWQPGFQRFKFVKVIMNLPLSF